MNETEETYDGPERRAGYAELHEEMEGHVDEIQARFKRFFTMSLVSFACIGLTTMAGLLSFGFILREHDRTNKAVAKQAALIQKQREEFIRNTCQETNRRHDRALKLLADTQDRVLHNAPDERARSEAAQEFELLADEVEVLNPKQDCERLVRSSVIGGGP